MITIYHNARCSKSREGLEVLKSSGKEFTVREYLKEPLSKKELKDILKKLNLEPDQIIRKNEKIWKENYKDSKLTEDELVEALINHPKLIERPIIVNKEKAVVGRPSSEIHKII